MEKFPERLEQLRVTRAKINWDQVLKIASSIRGQSCASDGKEFSGGCNIVYCITLEDKIRWALRIPFDEDPCPIETTVTTMRYALSAVPDMPIAAVHAWSDSEDGNGVGTPYILMYWIDGKTSEWTASFPPPIAREKILAQLVQYSVDLLVRTSMQPSNTKLVLEWTLRKIGSRLRRIFSAVLPFDRIDCLIQRAMAEENYHLSSLDTHPFPLMHTDLSRLNILVDDNFNITGILDWDDWALRLPLQCPMRYLVVIAAHEDPHDVFRNDRLSFIDHFTAAIKLSGLRDDIAAHLPSILAEDELQIFYISLNGKGAYASWVTKYSIRNTQWIQAAIRALDKFILIYPELGNLAKVLSVRVRFLVMLEEGLEH